LARVPFVRRDAFVGLLFAMVFVVMRLFALRRIVPNYSTFRKRNNPGRWQVRALPLFEIARVLVRVDHVASFIVNANHGVIFENK